MKTAISIPDDDFQAAEKLASRLGMTRSELYQRAISDLVEKHSQQKVTEKLNEVYESESDLSIEDNLMQLQMKSISSEEW